MRRVAAEQELDFPSKADEDYSVKKPSDFVCLRSGAQGPVFRITPPSPMHEFFR